MRGRVPKGGGQGFNPLPSTGPRQKAVLSKLVQKYSSLPHKRENGLGPFVKISFLETTSGNNFWGICFPGDGIVKK